MKRSILIGCLMAVISLPAFAADKNVVVTERTNPMSEHLSAINTSLTLAQANRIIDAAIVTARQHKMLPLALVVLDGGSNLVAFMREDGAGNMRFEIARGKANAALGMGMSTRMIRNRLGDRVAFQAALAAASNGQFIPTPGGVLILNEAGVAIGAIGISGDASDKDEYCAITAVRGVGLGSEPEVPNPAWNDSTL